MLAPGPNPRLARVTQLTALSAARPDLLLPVAQRACVRLRKQHSACLSVSDADLSSFQVMSFVTCLPHWQTCLALSGLLGRRLLALRAAVGEQQQQQAAWQAALKHSQRQMACNVKCMQVGCAVGLTPTAALLGQLAAVVQVSEAITRVQAAAAAAEAAACGSQGRPGGSSTGGAGSSSLRQAVWLPTTALRLLGAAPPAVAASVPGQQLLQASLSSLLTAVKQQQAMGAAAGELVPADLAFCADVVVHALKAAAAGVPGSSGSSESGGSGSRSPHPAARLVLQLLVRCLMLCEQQVSRLSAVDAASAVDWMSAVLPVGGWSATLTGCAWAHPQSNLDSLERFCLCIGDVLRLFGRDQDAAAFEAAQHDLLADFYQWLKVCTTQQQLQQQQQQQQRRQKGGMGKHKKSSSARQPPPPGDAGDMVGRFVFSLTRAAGLVTAEYPSRFCCNTPGCVNLSTVSEGFGLVRGPSCVCGGCGRARYCSVECQAAHWALEHKGVCGKLRSLFGAAAAAAEQQAVGPAE